MCGGPECLEDGGILRWAQRLWVFIVFIDPSLFAFVSFLFSSFFPRNMKIHFHIQGCYFCNKETFILLVTRILSFILNGEWMAERTSKEIRNCIIHLPLMNQCLVEVG